MGTGVLLTIGSLFYVVCLSIAYFKKIRLNTLENKIFKRIIISNICGLILHLILFCMMTFVGTSSIYTIIISKLYLVYLITYMTLFTVYAFIISAKNRNFLEDNFKKLILGVILIISLISLFIFYLPIEFHNESSKMYSFGVSVNLVYVFGFLMIGFNVIFLLKNIKRALSKEYYPLLLYFALGLITTIFQYKYPYIQLITAKDSFIIFLMYLTIENPDIRMAKELAFANEQLKNKKDNTIDVLNDLSNKLQNSLSKLETFGYKKTDINNTEEMAKDLKYIRKYCINFVDKVNGLIDISKINSGNLTINEDEYETNNFITEIERLINKDIKIKRGKLPSVLYGDKEKIKQIIVLMYKYLSSKGNIDVELDYVVAGRFCKLKFNFVTNELDIHSLIYGNKEYGFKDYSFVFYEEKDNIEYDKIMKLISLVDANTSVNCYKDGYNELVLSINQRIINPYKALEQKEINKGVNVRYFNLSSKRILLLDDGINDIREMLLLLKPYKVNVDVAKNFNDFENYLVSNKTYDLIFIDDVIYGTNPEDYSVDIYERVAGYKNFKSIIMLSNDKEKNINEYLSKGYSDYIIKPLNKKSINEILKKYLK